MRVHPPEHRGEAAPPSARPRARLLAPTLAFCAAAALLGVWLALRPAPREATGAMGVAGGALAPNDHSLIDAAELARRRELVEPLLSRASDRNRAATDAAIARVHERFDAFRAAAPAFADDMASWGSRLGVLRRLPSDWWRRTTGDACPEPASDVERYVRAKFEKHVVAPGAVEGAARDALAQFADDLGASRNLLWAEIDAALRTRDAPVPENVFDAREAERRVGAEAAALASRHAVGTLGAGVAAFAVSTAGSIAAEQLAAQVIARVGVSAAAGAGASALGASAGATGAAAGTGATGGALAGPVGVVVGVGLGLAVGIAIDWWMTDEYKASLTAQVRERLTALETALIDGDENEPGLRAALAHAAQTMTDSQRSAALAGVEETAR